MTNVRWAADDSKLVSTGGADTSVMVWKHGTGASSTPTACGESDDSDTDSEEEGGEYF